MGRAKWVASALGAAAAALAGLVWASVVDWKWFCHPNPCNGSDACGGPACFPYPLAFLFGFVACAGAAALVVSASWLGSARSARARLET